MLTLKGKAETKKKINKSRAEVLKSSTDGTRSYTRIYRVIRLSYSSYNNAQSITTLFILFLNKSESN